MNRPYTALFVTALAVAALPATSAADTTKLDAAMRPLLGEYAKIHAALASDSTKNVAAAAKAIGKLAAKLDPATVTGEHAAHFRKLPETIKAAAAKLASAKAIAAQRAGFMELSRPFAMWATMSKPKGVNVVYCSMAKGSWLQTGKKIRNPYYGAQMLRCGEVVVGKDQGTADGHMKGGHAHP